jgi:hypothetical protein
LQLRENWTLGMQRSSSLRAILREIFNGICIGMLGLTGFECEYHVLIPIRY